MTDPLSNAIDALSALAGQNGGMPSRLDSPAMPERARTAHQAIASTARMETVKFLFEHPGSTRAELVASTGVSTNAARVSLEQLEELGYVEADFPPEARNGRTVRYTADREALSADLAVLVAYIVD